MNLGPYLAARTRLVERALGATLPAGRSRLRQAMQALREQLRIYPEDRDARQALEQLERQAQAPGLPWSH